MITEISKTSSTFLVLVFLSSHSVKIYDTLCSHIMRPVWSMANACVLLFHLCLSIDFQSKVAFVSETLVVLNI